MTIINKIKGYVPTKLMLLALDESIEHWKRMIAWVKTRCKNERVSRKKMLLDIKENWYGEHCSLCINFGDVTCEYCILYKHGVGCGFGYMDEKNLWYKINYSVTWQEWLICAEKFLELMQKIRMLYNKKAVKHVS